VRTGQVRDRSSDLQHPVVRPRREVEPPHCLAQNRLNGIIEPTVTSKVSGAHVGIRVYPSLLSKPYALNGPSALHPLPDDEAGFTALLTG
jgi:hypothetical protein